MISDYHLRLASILIDAFGVITGMAGVPFPSAIKNNKRLIRKIAQLLIKCGPLHRLLKALIEQFTGDLVTKCQAISNFVFGCYKIGIFWEIMHCIYSEMTMFDYLTSGATMAATFLANVATGGAATVAKWSLVGINIFSLAEKILDFKNTFC